MKIEKIYKITLLALLAVGLGSCEDDEGALEVYMPAANAVVNATFDITDTINYNVSLVGADYPTVSVSSGSEVTVNFSVDADKLASYNQSMGTNFTLLPADNFTFDATGTISKGEAMSMPLNLVIKNGETLEPFSSYLLPISINEVNGGSPGNVQQTTYFILTRSPSLENLPTMDRSTWTIEDISTEEPGEGGGNGLADKVLDEDWGTYWHTQWAGSEPPPPHHITIDMGEEVIVHGISLVNRDLKDWAHGQPNAIKVALSTDGVDFVDNGSFSSPMGTDPVQEEVRFFLPAFKSARYLRITVNSSWGDTNSISVAEIYAL